MTILNSSADLNPHNLGAPHIFTCNDGCIYRVRVGQRCAGTTKVQQTISTAHQVLSNFETRIVLIACWWLVTGDWCLRLLVARRRERRQGSRVHVVGRCWYYISSIVGAFYYLKLSLHQTSRSWGQIPSNTEVSKSVGTSSIATLMML